MSMLYGSFLWISISATKTWAYTNGEEGWGRTVSLMISNYKHTQRFLVQCYIIDYRDYIYVSSSIIYGYITAERISMRHHINANCCWIAIIITIISDYQLYNCLFFLIILIFSLNIDFLDSTRWLNAWKTHPWTTARSSLPFVSKSLAFSWTN